jgi:hypothetical protein
MRATTPALAALMLAPLACSGDGGQGPSTGHTLQVSVATTGLDFDTDGYRVVVGGTSARFQPNALPGTSAGFSLSPGTYPLVVEDLTPNCAMDGPVPMLVEIPSYSVAPRELVRVTVPIVCRALFAEIQVTIHGAGRDFPVDGFTLQVAGPSTPLPGVVKANTPTLLAAYHPGTYSIGLTALPDHCAAEDATPQVLSVTTGGLERDRASAVFAVTCQAITGDIRVSTRTTGFSADVRYAVTLDGSPVIVPIEYFYYYGYYYDAPLIMLPNDTYLVERVVPGTHELSLSDIPSNCSISGQHPRTISVALGAATDAAFEVVCS